VRNAAVCTSLTLSGPTDIAVSMKPGAMALTQMPKEASSIANDRVN